MADAPRVDVLIVTLCSAGRAASIRRAVATTLAQVDVDARLVIAVNGERYDRELFEELRQTRGVTLLYQQTPSIFLARRLAREHVGAPFFGFIDDDDELLPGALATRVKALVHDPSADVVVTNGFVTNGHGVALVLGNVAGIRRDPLLALLHANWLATASALFRTATIGAEYFDVTLRSNDMTFLAFRLALEKTLAFVDEPTYRKIYSADSISLTDDWALPALATLDKMRRFDIPATARRVLRRKSSAAAHDISEIYRRRGQLREAWRYHLRSLAQPSGLLSYALYTRHLLRGEKGPGRMSGIGTDKAQ